jgi:nucleoside-diphosphate-sugar epimerase
MTDGYRGRRTLITGGLGFLGSALAVRLADLGAQVTVVDLPGPLPALQRARREQLPATVAWQPCDVCDTPRLAGLLEPQDVVFWLAAQVSHIGSMEAPLADLDVNYRSLLAALEACRPWRSRPRFVFTSTRQVYGRAESLPITEAQRPRPVDLIGIHKLAAEQALRLYAEVYGLSTVSLRLTNTYGPGMDFDDPRKGVAGVLIGQAVRGEPLTLFGGEQRRDFNFVDDVVDALLRAGRCDELSGDGFNLGHPQPRSLREFAETLGRLLPVSIDIVPFPAERQAIDPGDSYCDFSRFQRATGWFPQYDLASGLRETLAALPQVSVPQPDYSLA